MQNIETAVCQIIKSGIVVFAGTGNDIRGDDGVGRYVISAVKRRFLADDFKNRFYFIDAGQMPENYIGKIISIGPDAVVIVDSLHFGGESAELKILKTDKLKEDVFSTHGMSLKIFENQLKQASGDMEIFILGIQPLSMILGEGLTDLIKSKADKLIDFLCEEMIKNA